MKFALSILLTALLVHAGTIDAEDKEPPQKLAHQEGTRFKQTTVNSALAASADKAGVVHARHVAMCPQAYSSSKTASPFLGLHQS